MWRVRSRPEGSTEEERVAWQQTRTQQWLMQQWKNCVFYGVRSEDVFSLGSDQRLYISANELQLWLEYHVEAIR
jgi:hypothetical protein